MSTNQRRHRSGQAFEKPVPPTPSNAFTPRKAGDRQSSPLQSAIPPMDTSSYYSRFMGATSSFFQSPLPSASRPFQQQSPKFSDYESDATSGERIDIKFGKKGKGRADETHTKKKRTRVKEETMETEEENPIKEEVFEDADDGNPDPVDPVDPVDPHQPEPDNTNRREPANPDYWETADPNRPNENQNQEDNVDPEIPLGDGPPNPDPDPDDPHGRGDGGGPHGPHRRRNGSPNRRRRRQNDPDDPDDSDDSDDSDDMFRKAFLSIAVILDRMERRGRGSTNREPTRSNLREPDTFDGEDPSKLKEFLAQCGYHFSERPKTFATDNSKILYVISYLRGDAQAWFSPDEYDDGTLPYWDGDFAAFIDELRGNFGPTDPIGDAETRITYLRMKSSDRIVRYMIRFNRLASQLAWGDAALRHQFYRGLPDRLKDEMAKMGYENTLMGVRNAAQRLDQRYWTRELEKRRDSNDTDHPKSTNKPKAKSFNSKSNFSGNKSKSTNSRSSSNQFSDSRPSTSKPKPAYASKLGSDGKITQAEKDRRRKEGLCLYCGGKGHNVENCKKRPAESNAKASKVKDENPKSVSAEPKK